MSRLNYYEVDAKSIKGLLEIEKYVHQSGLEPSLYELVKIRASQINGCAYCLNMHTRDARKAGETEQRIYLLSAWRETELYTEREKAALEWTEAMTLIAGKPIPDEIYNQLSQHFSESEIVALSMAIVAINSWNRLAISFEKKLED
ncbi:carboxymuconolactone decarboxylase family protein [Elizabethkingia sp. JS20170427COW]|uniref:carboxymuconolactone decarboxylase family protein n=1 Tax=Elizabethkingia sp. JS20170427COW TaxID=2583851 RepID=UPI001C8879E7|nr:carboxymuconolactone decarboxylase family protein [Elizabethkingia sp. JS20170427COW]